MTYAVIMAGGVGSRFWPLSRRSRPKQFLQVFGDESLLQQTRARLDGFIPPERTLVVTNRDYVGQTRAQLPEVPSEFVLAEPEARNTAPAIAFAAARLHEASPEAVMVVLPADHFIGDEARFREILAVAVEKAREPGAIVTIGITPTHPATGYGYIHFDDQARSSDDRLAAVRVFGFKEKPPRETAEAYLASGAYLWNSGMFVWRVDTIREALRRHMPDLYAAFEPVPSAFGGADEEAAVARAFAAAPATSIDYGVMEKAEAVFVVPGAFGWNDVGDWRAVYDLSPKDTDGNATRGEAVLLDAAGCYVDAGDRLVAVLGVEDLVVVDTGDAVLVCPRDRAQDVKALRALIEQEDPDRV